MKILILDDDDAILDLCNKFLSDSAESIFKSLTQEAALNYLKLNKVELLIVDYKLEDGTGLDFIKNLRSNGDETRCILCSSSIDQEIIKIASLYNNVELIEKPFSKEELLKIVNPMKLI
ncbi:MAG: response regulator [Bdellovibrionales bacterium]|jgi:DNA-binding response OmpR family regulator|nr:response regulator [Bdellovibrionales bacterium]